MQMTSKNGEGGNVIFYVLLGIVLVGLLTVAIRNGGNAGKEDIAGEDMVLKAGEIQRHGAEVARAVAYILQDGASEADIRFAPPDDNSTQYGDITTTPTLQVFGTSGGRATYRAPPANMQNTTANWEFFATTAIPQIGSDKPELVAVLPDVTEAFCKAINNQLGFDQTTQPTDHVNGTTPDCVMGGATDRFDGTYDDTGPNEMDDTTFSRLPSAQACVYCASNSTYNYYYVLMSR